MLAASLPTALRKRLVTAMWCGAVAGMVFSDPEMDLSFSSLPALSSLGKGLVGMICIFGLPAGIILAIRDRAKGNSATWTSMVKVPAIFTLGLLLLFGILAIPIVIDETARLAEWLTGDGDDGVVRRATGTVVGALLGPIVLAALLVASVAHTRLFSSPAERAD